MGDKVILTAEEIYEMLLNKEHIKSSKGYIRFNLCDIEMVVKTKDIVGGAIENWIRVWMEQNNIAFDVNPFTQTKPDVYLNPNNHEKNLLEIKAFNNEKEPAFDIADFKGFAEEMISKPYLLDIDCLVFGYIMNEETGDITIKNIWLKKMWEMCGSSGIWPIKVQGSKDMTIIKKVRPVTWYSERSRFNPFESKFDFLSAYEQTLYEYGATKAYARRWRFQLTQRYKNYYGEDLVIPRWDDIKSKYNGR